LRLNGDDLVDLKARNRQLQQCNSQSCSASTASSTTLRCASPSRYATASEECALSPVGEMAPTSFEAGASQLLAEAAAIARSPGSRRLSCRAIHSAQDKAALVYRRRSPPPRSYAPSAQSVTLN
jgi:hypothetical protein